MLDAIKRTIEPPYNIRDIYSIFVALFIMLLLPITVYQVTNSRDYRSNATIFSNPETDNNILVSISSLKDGQTVSGKVELTVEASSENSTISSVGIYSDSTILATLTNPSNANSLTNTIAWDTTKEGNGPKNLFATATNDSGLTSTSSNIAVVVANHDSSPPSISFSNLNDGDYLGKNSYLVKLAASDDTGISSVEFSIDGQLVQRFNKVPYEFSLDLTNLTTGNHTLKASATDYLGNFTSQTIQIYRGLGLIKN